MAAPKGNQFWLARSSHGRKPKFANKDDLWKAACEYFQWVEDNPLWEAKLVSYQGLSEVETIPKMRAMTQAGLQLFIDISHDAWENYRNREGFVVVVSEIEAVIRDQKFSGAAADLLNANIIARDLGLKDKSEQALTGADGGAIKMITTEMSEEEASEIYKENLNK